MNAENFIRNSNESKFKIKILDEFITLDANGALELLVDAKREDPHSFRAWVQEGVIHVGYYSRNIINPDRKELHQVGGFEDLVFSMKEDVPRISFDEASDVANSIREIFMATVTNACPRKANRLAKRALNDALNGTSWDVFWQCKICLN